MEMHNLAKIRYLLSWSRCTENWSPWKIPIKLEFNYVHFWYVSFTVTWIFYKIFFWALQRCLSNNPTLQGRIFGFRIDKTTSFDQCIAGSVKPRLFQIQMETFSNRIQSQIKESLLWHPEIVFLKPFFDTKVK